MGDTTFTFTTELAEKFYYLRLRNEQLFKKKKQPWKDFYKILLDNGFPKTITIGQITKKWSNSVSAYLEAKSKKNKSWPYYSIFEKIFGNNKSIDKYESWNEEWRLKLIDAIQNSHQKTSNKASDGEFWRAVESELRSTGLPLECCVQDIRGLFCHLRKAYHRKCTIEKREPSEEWARLEPTPALRRLSIAQRRQRALQARAARNFAWTHDMTESFIQIRLQHEWLFKERKQPWHDFAEIMVENGYPELSHIFIQKKWQDLYRVFQKVQASNNTNWIYYSLFQKYLGENYSNLENWQERWVLELIQSRTRHHDSFLEYGSWSLAWRMVERDLRCCNIPLDHSLLNLMEMWKHLKKTFKYKSSFAAKGLLSEAWPYYEAMERFCKLERQRECAPAAAEGGSTGGGGASDSDGGFDEDDVKPLSRVSKVEVAVEPNGEWGRVGAAPRLPDGDTCRACGERGACAAVCGAGQQTDISSKLSAITGVKVEESDGLPNRICAACLKRLEDAYKFRLKCQEMDRQYRSKQSKNNAENEAMQIKEESILNDDKEFITNDDTEAHHGYDTPKENNEDVKKVKTTNVKLENVRKKQIKRRETRTGPAPPRNKDKYKRVCEICGKNVLNIKEHKEGHTGTRFACEVCGKTFKYKSALSGHRSIHRDTPVKVCQVCGKSFKQMNKYVRHYAYHADERRHHCGRCGKRFNSVDVLRVHERIHTEERPYGCPECGHTFRTAGCVTRHRRLVHKLRVDRAAPHSFKLKTTAAP